MKLYSRFSNTYLIGLGLKGRPLFSSLAFVHSLQCQMELRGLQTLRRTGDGLGEVSWPIKTRPGVMLIAGKLRPWAAMCLIPHSVPHNHSSACLPHIASLFSLPSFFPPLQRQPELPSLDPSLPWRANQTHLELPRALLAAGSASNSWSTQESLRPTPQARHPTHTDSGSVREIFQMMVQCTSSRITT